LVLTKFSLREVSPGVFIRPSAPGSGRIIFNPKTGNYEQQRFDRGDWQTVKTFTPSEFQGFSENLAEREAKIVRREIRESRIRQREVRTPLKATPKQETQQLEATKQQLPTNLTTGFTLETKEVFVDPETGFTVGKIEQRQRFIAPFGAEKGSIARTTTIRPVSLAAGKEFIVKGSGVIRPPPPTLAETRLKELKPGQVGIKDVVKEITSNFPVTSEVVRVSNIRTSKAISKTALGKTVFQTLDIQEKFFVEKFPKAKPFVEASIAASTISLRKPISTSLSFITAAGASKGIQAAKLGRTTTKALGIGAGTLFAAGKTYEFITTPKEKRAKLVGETIGELTFFGLGAKAGVQVSAKRLARLEVTGRTGKPYKPTKFDVGLKKKELLVFRTKEGIVRIKEVTIKPKGLPIIERGTGAVLKGRQLQLKPSKFDVLTGLEKVKLGTGRIPRETQLTFAKQFKAPQKIGTIRTSDQTLKLTLKRFNIQTGKQTKLSSFFGKPITVKRQGIKAIVFPSKVVEGKVKLSTKIFFKGFSRKFPIFQQVTRQKPQVTFPKGSFEQDLLKIPTKFKVPELKTIKTPLISTTSLIGLSAVNLAAATTIIPKLKIKSISRLDFPTIQISRLKTFQIPTQEIKPLQAQKTPLRTIVTPVTTITTRQITRLDLKLITPSLPEIIKFPPGRGIIRRPPLVPTKTPIITKFPLIEIPKLKVFDRKLKIGVPKRKLKFAPSVIATANLIKGKTIRPLTGFEIRKIPLKVM